MADSGAGEDCKHDEENSKMSEEESEFEDQDSIYEVEKIVGISKDGDKTVYKVRWKGYGVEDDTWEPKDNLLTCEDLIDEYVAKEEKKKSTKKSGRGQPLEKETKAPAKERNAPKQSIGQPKKKKKRKRSRYEQEVPAAEERRDRKKSHSTDEEEEQEQEEQGKEEEEDKGDGEEKMDVDEDKEEEEGAMEKGKRGGKGETMKGKKKEQLESAKMGAQEMPSESGKESHRKEREEKEKDEDLKEKKEEGKEGKGEEKKKDETEKKKEEAEQRMDVEEVDEEALLKDPFWDQLEKGLIQVSFETDMYSKVKNRRAVLDAKREEMESKQKEDEHSKKKKKKKEHKKEKKAKKEKRKKDKHKKTKKMVDLEMLGSLESATKRTLMMSPSALDTSANSANMYRSSVPSEQMLTIAQLEEKAASTSGGTTPCKLESMDSSSSQSSNSSTLSQEMAITPESPSSDKATDPHAAFFGDLCKTETKTEILDTQETSQLQDFANVLPTPEVDEADRQICDAVLTPLSPCDVDRGLSGFPSDATLQDGAVLNRLVESDSKISLQTLPSTSPLLDDKTISNLPTPPEVDNRSVFNMLQSGNSSRDADASQQDSASTIGHPAQSSVYNMYQSEQSKLDYRVQEVNLFGNLRQASGNVQMDVNSAKKGGAGEAGGTGGDGMQGQVVEPAPSHQFQPPTPPASLFSSFSTAAPKPSPLMPLSEGTPNRTLDLKSPLNSPLTPHTPSTSFTPQATPQGTPSPKSYMASQKSPPFPNTSASSGRNAFEKIQTFQLSSAHGRNSAKVQSLKDKLSKYVSPTSRKEDNFPMEKGIGDISRDQQQLQTGQLSELSVDTGLANAYRSSDVAGQPQPLSQIERQIQRIEMREGDRPQEKVQQLSHTVPGSLALNQDNVVPEPQRQESIEGILGNQDGIQSSNTLQGMGPLATYEGLRQAIKTGNTQGVVHMLQQTGPRALEEVDNMGTTPLMLACSLNQDDIVKALILNGAIVNKTHKNGMTPLMMAAERGFTSTVGILLEAGAYINSTTPAGESALMQACRRGHKDVVRLLLEYGANWMVTARDGSSALGFALHHNQRSVQDMLHAHVQRLCCELEATASQFLYGTARILKSVFPLHCYRLREATEHVALVSFDANNYYCYQGSGMLLFLAQATLGPGWSISCKLSGSSYIKQVLLNGRYLPQLTQGSNFVLSYTPRSGQNVLTISTVPDPYTNTLLLVGAYTVQIGSHHTAMH